MAKTTQIEVQGVVINLSFTKDSDYICITDMANAKDGSARAADIIKKAMISVSEKMFNDKLKSKLLLQVHDELIFEVPMDEVDSMQSLVKECMEGAASLKVPLKVDMGIGDNWYGLK
jgi:DNA polymerase I-like protein with 3'-5' exonuclease and polymerase domains